MQVFKRKLFNQLWFTLQSSETLGVLDSSYLKDYYGNESQVTLFNTETLQRFPIPMEELPEETPTIANDVFSGYVDLTTIPDGSYRIEGLVRDLAGNYTILSEIETTLGSERVIPFDLRITDDEVIVMFGATTITRGTIFSVPLPSVSVFMDTPLVKNLNIFNKINKVSNFSTAIVEYLTTNECQIIKGVNLQASINKTLEVSARIEPNG